MTLPPADRRLERVPLVPFVPLEARLTVLRAGLAIVSLITE